MLSHTGLGAHPGGTVQLGALDQGIPLMSSSASLKQDNTGTCLRVLLRFCELSHSKYSMKGSCSLLTTVMIWEAAGSQAYSALAAEGGDFPRISCSLTIQWDPAEASPHPGRTIPYITPISNWVPWSKGHKGWHLSLTSPGQNPGLFLLVTYANTDANSRDCVATDFSQPAQNNVITELEEGPSLARSALCLREEECH